MGIAVIVEAILSFVGLSVSSDRPTWGRHDRRGAAVHSSDLVGVRGSARCLFATVLAFNQLGDGLRWRLFDPLLRR
jgi:peptide/nickel transport system permease protein